MNNKQLLEDLLHFYYHRPPNVPARSEDSSSLKDSSFIKLSKKSLSQLVDGYMTTLGEPEQKIPERRGEYIYFVQNLNAMEASAAKTSFGSAILCAVGGLVSGGVGLIYDFPLGFLYVGTLGALFFGVGSYALFYSAVVKPQQHRLIKDSAKRLDILDSHYAERLLTAEDERLEGKFHGLEVEYKTEGSGE
ncbi:MAG TPA: hypothetical protein VJG49_03985 [Candidatus Nanoarchaeia archaeon]|nr:hypothetical protein [Candidatus Nanoarchaeia archaeon]